MKSLVAAVIAAMSIGGSAQALSMQFTDLTAFTNALGAISVSTFGFDTDIGSGTSLTLIPSVLTVEVTNNGATGTNGAVKSGAYQGNVASVSLPSVTKSETAFQFATAINAVGFTYTTERTRSNRVSVEVADTITSFDFGSAGTVDFADGVGGFWGYINTDQAFDELRFLPTFGDRGGRPSSTPNTAGFTVDNLQYGAQGVAPVPLPAGLPLLLAALGVLGLMRRRKTA